MSDNPLALGTHCPVCGCRLDKPERPCPFSPHDEDSVQRGERRLRILNDSALIFAMAANA